MPRPSPPRLLVAAAASTAAATLAPWVELRPLLAAGAAQTGAEVDGLLTAGPPPGSPALPWASPASLSEPERRESFLAALFSLARLRELGTEPPWSALIDYHASHKYLLMAHSVRGQKSLGHLLAEERHAPDLAALYRAQLGAVLARHPSRGQRANALQHTLGHLRRRLAAPARRRIEANLEAYARAEVDYGHPAQLLRRAAAACQEPYLLRSVLFLPYPAPLLAPGDPRGADRAGTAEETEE